MRNESGGPSQNPTSVDPSDWRKGVLDAWSILLAIPLGGGVAYSLAVNPVFSGSPWLRVPLMAAVAMVVASTARRLPYATRVGLLTLGLYILWSFNLLRSPYRPAEVAMGIAVVFTAAVLLPVRWAIATWLFSVATVVTIVLLVAAGGVPISVDPAAVDPRLPSAGLQIVIVHSMFAGAIGVATTLIVNRLSDSREATRAAESSLRIREAHWRSLLDNAADSIVTVTSDYWIEFLNHRVSGYGAEGAAVLRIGDLSPSDEEVSRRRAAVDRVFETGESVTLEADWVDREGVSHPWSMRFSPILKDGDVDRVAIISTDLSERRALEEQLRQSQKMQAVGELTGGLAHDFNNLLTVVMGNLELLMAELDDGAETRELAALALEAATRGAGITHRLLAFSRRQVLHPRVVDLAELTVGTIHRSLDRDT